MARITVIFVQILYLFSGSSEAFVLPTWVDYMKPKYALDGFDYGKNTFHQEYPYSKGPINDVDQYDFIIVGSGPAGSVLASRLSENPLWQVLLIESGKPETAITDIPLLAPWLTLSDYTTHYKMAKQDGVCLGMVDQRCGWPRGKALGGTSVINYMIYTRGNEHDYNRWEAQGNPGWSWNDVLPYFIRAENTNLKKSDQGYHGNGGYLDIEDIRYRTQLSRAFIQAAKKRGHQILDYNGRSQMGFGRMQANIRKGKRCSAAKAYLKPTEGRPNLRILPMSHATKVLIDPNTKQAYGVQYIRNKRNYTAYARKEVILSAGPIASPQLLMLSGVGPKNHLNEMKIPVIKDLPVGEILEDHLTFVGLAFVVNQTAGIHLGKLAASDAPYRYLYNQTGPMAVPGGVEALGYIKTSESPEVIDYPDIELIFLSGALNTDGGASFKDTQRIRKDFYDAVYKNINYNDSWTVLPMLLHPKSKGYMRLRSQNPYNHPILYGNYFTDPEGKDLDTMVAAVKEIISLSETSPFQKFGTRFHEAPYPGCEQFEPKSDAYWRCAIRSLCASLHHQVATCKMGPRTDPTAVVDAKLRVYGVKNLRVVDTSIIPFALSAHTSAPSFMIGEKATDFIRADWNSLVDHPNSVYHRS